VEKLDLLEGAGEEVNSLYQIGQLQITTFGCSDHSLDEQT
jgi:hypothetical protein